MADDLEVTHDPASDTDPWEGTAEGVGTDPAIAGSETPTVEAEPSLADLVAHFGPKEGDVDPNAQEPAAGEIPAAFQEALSVSEYVQSPEQLTSAVRRSAELQDVETGKTPPWQMLEGFRARDPQNFERILSDPQNGLIPYIEHVTGKKFGGADPAVDPNDPKAVAEQMRRDLADRDRRATEAVELQRTNETINRANTIGSQRVTELLKDTPFAGSEAEMFTAVIAKVQAMKMSPQRVMSETLSGNFSSFDRALKAVQQDKMQAAMKFNEALKQQYLKQKKTLPTSKSGNVRTSAGDGKIGPNSTREDLVSYLAGDPA